LYINKGGLAIYGGIIGGLLGGCLVCKAQKINLFSALDVASLGLLIGQGIGRWGNFFNQEAFGSETDLPWRMISENTGNVGVHPCFLYESLWCLLGVLVLHIISKKWYNFKGQIFLCYMVWYGAERMIVEGLRADSLYMPFSIFGYTPRVSQVLSACIFVAGIVLLIIFRKKRNVKNGNNNRRKESIGTGEGASQA
jgi:phosphatidylglycerol:prolipoprotein diacylglycerol transferase